MEGTGMTELERRANDMRADIARLIAEAGSGHPGGHYHAPTYSRRCTSAACWSTTRATCSGEGATASSCQGTRRRRFTPCSPPVGYFPREELGHRCASWQPAAAIRLEPGAPGVEVSTGLPDRGLSVVAEGPQPA